MRDERPGQSVDAREALEDSGGELGQLAVEPGREVLLDLSNLLFDDVEVVEKPLGGGGDGAGLPTGLRNRPLGLKEHSGVLAQTRQEPPPGCLPDVDGLFGRQRRGELLQVLRREKFGTNRVAGRSHQPLLNTGKKMPSR